MELMLNIILGFFGVAIGFVILGVGAIIMVYTMIALVKIFEWIRGGYG